MLYTLRTILGVLLIIVAIITGPIPVIQGWWFFLLALAVLGPNHPISKWCWVKIKWGRQKLNEWGIWKQKDLPPDGPPPV
jgi:hypothetical protein